MNRRSIVNSGDASLPATAEHTAVHKDGQYHRRWRSERQNGVLTAGEMAGQNETTYC